MADNSRPVIQLNIPSVNTGNEKEKTNAGGGGAGGAGDGDMPSVTQLLNRKKLNLPPASSENSTAAQPALEVASVVPDVNVPDINVPDISLSTSPSIVRSEAPAVDLGGAGEIAAAENFDPSALAPADDAPAIAPARRRGAAKMVSVDEEPAFENAAAATAGEPPAFQGTLALEALDFAAFQKAIKKHKKSRDMKKLDCLGYFSTRFSEIIYFEVSQAGELQGVLGFGNRGLVLNARAQTATPDLLPSIFEVLSQGEIFVGPIESLRGEDQSGIASLGFTTTACVGAFPLTYKKAVTGLWLCAGSQLHEIPAKELKALKKFLSDFVL